MNRRGFALLTILWILAVAAAAAASLMAAVTVAIAVSGNRIALLNAEWAREACEQVVQARYARTHSMPAPDTIQLGGGRWCAYRLVDARSLVNLNHAPREQLAALFGTDSVAAAIIDWRDPDRKTERGDDEDGWYRAEGRPTPRNAPLESVLEVQLVRGVDSDLLKRAIEYATVAGDGRINVNSASEVVLATLPLFNAAGARRLVSRRAAEPFTATEEVIGLLPPFGQSVARSSYGMLAAAVAFDSGVLEEFVVGGNDRHPAGATAYVRLRPVESRLAVIRREVP